MSIPPKARLQKRQDPGLRALIPFHDIAPSQKLHESLSGNQCIASEACP